MLEDDRLRSELRHRLSMHRVEHPLASAVRQNYESGELKSLVILFTSCHDTSYPLEEPCSPEFLLRRAGTIAGRFKRALRAFERRVRSDLPASWGT
jgi:hypothetical protein